MWIKSSAFRVNEINSTVVHILFILCYLNMSDLLNKSYPQLLKLEFWVCHDEKIDKRKRKSHIFSMFNFQRIISYM